MKTNFSTPKVPISWGELIDKITILEIKHTNISSPAAQENLIKELQLLSAIVDENTGLLELVKIYRQELKAVNSQLWIVEDDIRDKELKSEFDTVFVELARSVYRLNDIRAQIKQSINSVLNSEIVEVKSYKAFQ